MLKILLKTTGFSPKKQEIMRKSYNNPQSGSVIIWILIAVALFAALNFAINQGSRSGSATITKEKAALAATEILDYTQAIKRAVQTLQINGCSDTEISFENNTVAGYVNANAPTDESCHVFKLNGGGLNYQAPEEDWLDTTQSAQTYYNNWFTSSRYYIVGLGVDGTGSACGGTGDCRELITGIPFIKQEICTEINKKLGWGTDDNGTPYKDTANSYGHSGATQFTGTYTNAGASLGTATPSNYSNVMAGCIEGDTNPPSGAYSFFQVLIVR